MMSVITIVNKLIGKERSCLSVFLHVCFISKNSALLKFGIGICSKVSHINFSLVSGGPLFGGTHSELKLYYLIFDGIENYSCIIQSLKN
jgi:hypothetical protein